MVQTRSAGGGRGPGGCVRAAPALLAHLSLLFVMYSGALALTVARLKWDPSLYVVVREAAPREYRAACALLPAAAAALLLLAHLALAARDHTDTTTLYIIYAVCTLVLLVLELCFAWWLYLRVVELLSSEAVRRMRDTLVVRDRLLALLAALDHWHPLPNRIKELIEEAEADLPWSAYLCGASAALLVAAQLVALLLAVLSARLHHYKHNQHQQHSRGLHSHREQGDRVVSHHTHHRALLEPQSR